MAPQQKISRLITLELEAGNAAMVDLGKMLGPTGINTRQLKMDYDAATAGQRGDIVPVVSVEQMFTHHVSPDHGRRAQPDLVPNAFAGRLGSGRYWLPAEDW